MKLRRLRVIAYDIACDRRRHRMQMLAQSVAARVQDSVYEGWLSDAEAAAFLRHARAHIHPPADSLRMYTLCQTCRENVRAQGSPAPAPPPDDVLT